MFGDLSNGEGVMHFRLDPEPNEDPQLDFLELTLLIGILCVLIIGAIQNLIS